MIGGGGVKLHVREWGNPNGVPLLFVHGWSQSHLSWARQYESDLAERFRIVAFDLRGHGISDAPMEREQYADGEKWADDVAAIVEQLALAKPVLIGWSYGGAVVCDYVKKYGDRRLGGINFVAAAVKLGKASASLIGPGFTQHAPASCGEDLAANISALRNFLRACFGEHVAPEDLETALAYNMVVRPTIRRFLLKRELDFTPVLERIAVPVLVTHDRSDSVVLPAMSDTIIDHCKTAMASWYDGAGHLPFFAEPARFNSELARFALDARLR